MYARPEWHLRAHKVVNKGKTEDIFEVTKLEGGVLLHKLYMEGKNRVACLIEILLETERLYN